MKSDFKKAFQLARIGRTREAMPVLLSAVENGDPRAWYMLGNWHVHAIEVSKSYKKAADLFERAGRKNHKLACFDLAICYEGPGATKGSKEGFLLVFERGSSR